MLKVETEDMELKMPKKKKKNKENSEANLSKLCDLKEAFSSIHGNFEFSWASHFA